jgi:transcriptional regulator with XRE-family HTH domain
MIGNMIAMIRKEKGITKTKLAEMTGINIGHLTHIEKEERNPSHKALYSICKALDIPFEELLHTYDKTLTLEQEKYNYLKYIPYNKIPAFSNIEDFVECPSSFTNASFAYKVPDTSMEPIFSKDSFVFIEIAGLLENKDYGLFKVDNKILIRKLLYRKGGIVLRSENKELPDILVSELKNFQIIGKIYTNT